MRHPLLGASFGAALMLAASHAAAFDARNPADILSVINANGASATLKTDSHGAPWIDGKAGKLGFEVDFTNCEAANTRCKAALYRFGFDMTSISLDQLNGWNKWTLLCPAYESPDKHPHAWYALQLSANQSAEDIRLVNAAWLECMTDFDKFTDNPDAFLKAQGD